MKKRNLFPMLLLTAAASLTVACSDDDVVKAPEVGPAAGEPITAYANIKLTTPYGSTRAEEFEAGTASENNVESLTILFYNEAGVYAGKAQYATTDGWSTDPLPGNNVDTEKRFEWTEAQIVPLELLNGDATKAIAFVNYDASEYITGQTPLATVLTRTTALPISTANGFVMTNAGRYENDTYVVETAVKDYIFDSPEEAKKSPAITIYVERVAAKVELTIDANATEYDEDGEVAPITATGADGTVYTFAFEPKSWGVTATETSSYIFKTSPATKADYGEDTEFYNWLTTVNHRTFWAWSPNYEETLTYPAAGLENPNDNPAANRPDASLNYLTRGDLTTLAAENVLYTTEHTFPVIDLTSAENPYSVPTSVVISGVYTLTDDENNDWNGDFYLRKTATAEGYEYKVYTAEELLNSMVAAQYVIAKKNDAGEFVPVKEAEGVFELYNSCKRYKLIAGTTEYEEVASLNSYTLRLITDEDLYVYNVEAEGYYEAIGNLADAQELLQKNIGTAALYQGGNAFFYVPIQHYNPTAATNNGKFNYVEVKDEATGEVTGEELSTFLGEYATVRNHVYKLSVSTLYGLGYGDPGSAFLIPDGDDTEESAYWFHAKIEVLSWHVINNNVEL